MAVTLSVDGCYFSKIMISLLSYNYFFFTILMFLSIFSIIHNQQHISKSFKTDIDLLVLSLVFFICKIYFRQSKAVFSNIKESTYYE